MNKERLRKVIRVLVKPMFQPWVPFKVRRVLMNSAKLLSKKQKGVQRQHIQLMGIPTYQASPEHEPKRHILYLHGGGYVFGNENTHRQVVDGLALTCNANVYMPLYRLAPEHPFPAALNDAFDAYLTLLEQGILPENITIAGDSAGGGLTVALALKLKEDKRPLPSNLVLFSPWLDLTVSLDSHEKNADIDPMLIPAGLHSCAKAYCQNTPTNHPWCSPVYASLGVLEHLPPVLIQVGGHEILLDDAKHIHQKIEEAGGTSELQIFDDMWHVFQLHSHQLPEATEALEKVATYLDHSSSVRA